MSKITNMMRQNAQKRILCIMINKQTQTQERRFVFFLSNEWIQRPRQQFFCLLLHSRIIGEKIEKRCLKMKRFQNKLWIYLLCFVQWSVFHILFSKLLTGITTAMHCNSKTESQKPLYTHIPIFHIYIDSHNDEMHCITMKTAV